MGNHSGYLSYLLHQLLIWTHYNPSGVCHGLWYYDLSDLKVAKRKPLISSHFDEFFKLLPGWEESENSWTVTRSEIEAKNYDLKAVNPNRKEEVDTRTPEELLDIIERKGSPNS